MSWKWFSHKGTKEDTKALRSSLCLRGNFVPLCEIFFALLLIAVSVRVLTLQFMRAHLNDPAWFQVGSYAKFDRQARDILDGRQHLFWIDDATRTDLAQYPPAFPALVAFIYKVSGDRSAYSVQLVLWFLDLMLSFVLITGMALTAFGWRAAIASSFLLALSPLFAMYAAYPSADAPTTWIVLGGNWLLLVAFKRREVWLVLAAGGDWERKHLNTSYRLNLFAR